VGCCCRCCPETTSISSPLFPRPTTAVDDAAAAASDDRLSEIIRINTALQPIDHDTCAVSAGQQIVLPVSIIAHTGARIHARALMPLSRASFHLDCVGQLTTMQLLH